MTHVHQRLGQGTRRAPINSTFPASAREEESPGASAPGPGGCGRKERGSITEPAYLSDRVCTDLYMPRQHRDLVAPIKDLTCRFPRNVAIGGLL